MTFFPDIDFRILSPTSKAWSALTALSDTIPLVMLCRAVSVEKGFLAVRNVTSFFPYKHSTSGPPAGHQWLVTPGWQADSHPLGGSGSVCKAGHLQATTEPILLSSCPPLCLLMFQFTGFGGPTADLKLPLCQSQWHRVGFWPQMACWIVAASHLCAEHPHNYQWPAGGPLVVIRWPPLPPLYRHLPLGGRPCSTQKCL